MFDCATIIRNSGFVYIDPYPKRDLWCLTWAYSYILFVIWLFPLYIPFVPLYFELVFLLVGLRCHTIMDICVDEFWVSHHNAIFWLVGFWVSHHNAIFWFILILLYIRGLWCDTLEYCYKFCLYNSRLDYLCYGLIGIFKFRGSIH